MNNDQELYDAQLEELKKKLATRMADGAKVADLTYSEGWTVLEEWIRASLEKLKTEAVSTGLVGDTYKHAMLTGEYQGKKHLLDAVGLFIKAGNESKKKLTEIHAQEREGA
jgi:hypothetical protein